MLDPATCNASDAGRFYRWELSARYAAYLQHAPPARRVPLMLSAYVEAHARALAAGRVLHMDGCSGTRAEPALHCHLDLSTRRCKSSAGRPPRVPHSHAPMPYGISAALTGVLLTPTPTLRARVDALCAELFGGGAASRSGRPAGGGACTVPPRVLGVDLSGREDNSSVAAARRANIVAVARRTDAETVLLVVTSAPSADGAARALEQHAASHGNAVVTGAAMRFACDAARRALAAALDPVGVHCLPLAPAPAGARRESRAAAAEVAEVLAATLLLSRGAGIVGRASSPFVRQVGMLMASRCCTVEPAWLLAGGIVAATACCVPPLYDIASGEPFPPAAPRTHRQPTRAPTKLTPTVGRDRAKMQGGASRAAGAKTHGGARTEPGGRSVSSTAGSLPTDGLKVTQR